MGTYLCTLFVLPLMLACGLLRLLFLLLQLTLACGLLRLLFLLLQLTLARGLLRLLLLHLLLLHLQLALARGLLCLLLLHLKLTLADCIPRAAIGLCTYLNACCARRRNERHSHHSIFYRFHRSPPLRI